MFGIINWKQREDEYNKHYDPYEDEELEGESEEDDNGDD